MFNELGVPRRTASFPYNHHSLNDQWLACTLGRNPLWKKAQQYVGIEVPKSWFGQLFLTIIFPEYLSFQQEEYDLIFFSSFLSYFPKISYNRIFKKQNCV